MNFRIGFKLMNLDDLPAKSTNPDPIYMDNRQNLLKSLYALSLGKFWFEIVGHILPVAQPDWISRYPDHSIEIGIDYQVLHLFRDIEEFMPTVLQPAPDIPALPTRSGTWLPWKATLDRASGGPARNDIPEPYRDAVYSARAWWRSRKLEFWYLVAPPDIHIWSFDHDRDEW